MPDKATSMERLVAGRYWFRARLNSDWFAPCYAGSMLRGAFGHALRELACQTGMSDCRRCPLRKSCGYTRIFETDALNSVPTGFLQHPFVLELQKTERSPLGKGATYTFGMTLVGSSRALLPLIIQAWRKALTKGLGRTHSTLTLESVSLEGAGEIWSARSNSVALHSPVLLIPPAPDWPQLVLHLETPTRLKYRGQLVSPGELGVDALLLALRTRLKGTYPALTTSFETPTLRILDRTRWTQWLRHSNRQKKSMALGGLTGTLILEGDWQALWPALWLCQYLHIGKHTTFGMGQYRLKPGAIRTGSSRAA